MRINHESGCRFRRRRAVLAAAGVVFVASSFPAQAISKFYVGGGGLWQDGPWSTTQGGPANTTFPLGAMDHGFVISPTTFTVTTNGATNMANLGTVHLDGTGGAVVTLDKTAANNLGCIDLMIGNTGQASFTSGAGSVSAARFVMGQQNGASGTVLFGNTSLSISQSMTVGVNGVGDFRMNSGSIGVASGTVPLIVGSNNLGLFTQKGGNTSVGQLLTGNASLGFGVVTVAGGIFTVQTTTTLGGASGSGGGAVYLNGGTVSFNGAVTVNRSGTIYNQGATLLLSPSSGWTVNGGTADLGAQQYFLTPMNPIVVNDGYFAASNIFSIGGATVNWSAGTVALTGVDFAPASNPVFGTGSIVLPGTKALYVGGTTTLDPAHQIVINGGSFATGNIAGSFANVQFNSGTFRLTGNELGIRDGGLFGPTYTLDSNHRLETGNGWSAHIYPEGQLYLTGGALSAEGGISNEGYIQMASPVARIGGGAFDNFGLLQGTGRILGDFLNQIGGEVRVTAADTLRFEGNFNNNNGLINLLGGVADFTHPIHNDTNGRITGRGALQTGGIDNLGTIQLSAGISDVHGELTNSTGAKTIVSGNATASFYDDVTNLTGSEFRVSTNSTAVFFGTVTGLGQFTGSGVKDFEGNTLPGPIATPGSTLVGPAGNVVAQHVRESSLTVEGNLSIVANGTSTGVSRVGALNVDGGKIDLTNNALVVDYTSSSPIANIKSLIVSGRNGGTWTGNGITSSLANAGSFAVGYAEASSINVSNFVGQSVDGTTVLVRFTRYGDANLDGVVNALDFNALASHFAQSGKFWSDGDWNYDGTVNSLDFNALASNFNQALPSPPALVTLVPEPVMAFCAIFLTVPHRRRRNSIAVSAC